MHWTPSNETGQEVIVLWHERGRHVIKPYIIVSRTSIFSMRIFKSRGVLCRSYSSRIRFRKLHQALYKCRSTLVDRVAPPLTFPRCIRNRALVCTPGWLPQHWVWRWHRVSSSFANTLLLVSETVRPNATYMVTITNINFPRCSGDHKTTVAPSACIILNSDVAGAGCPAVATLWGPNKLLSQVSFYAFKRAVTTCITAAKTILIRKAPSAQFWRR